MRVGTREHGKPPQAGRDPGRAAAGGPADVGANLRRIRLQQGHSLEALAGLSGVSRAMLGQIETGKSAPTVTLIWKVASALGIPLSSLIESPRAMRAVVLPKASARVIASNGGGFTLRAFAAQGVEQRAEFYEMRVLPGHREAIDPYPPATRTSLAVAAGALEVTIEDGAPYRLEAGDALLFEADAAHEIHNPGTQSAIAYLVVAPARNNGGSIVP